MIWCVEDDTGIREIEVYTLQSVGLEARGFSCGADFFEAMRSGKPDLIILDIMLPDEDGTVILEKIRKRHDTSALPVIMATAKGEEYDKIKNLDLGADDYLVKPFGMMEMVSRVKAVMRRCTPKETKKELVSGAVRLDMASRTAFADEKPLELTFKELELLRLLMSNPNTAFTREQLLSEIWNTEYVGETRTVDVHIRTLRQKLGKYSEMIETVRNVGYKFKL